MGSYAWPFSCKNGTTMGGVKSQNPDFPGLPKRFRFSGIRFLCPQTYRKRSPKPNFFLTSSLTFPAILTTVLWNSPLNEARTAKLFGVPRHITFYQPSLYFFWTILLKRI